MSRVNPFTPYHQYAYSPYCSPYISEDADGENLVNNQELLQLVIISFIHVTLMSDAGAMLYGEIRYWLLLRVRRLM